MIGESFCVSKELFRCVYITKDNVEEFVDKYGIRDEYEIFYSEYYAHVEYKKAKMRWNIRLNAFMVDYGWDGGWTSYTKKEFNEYFEIKN